MPPELDPHYTDPRLVALYDIECGWSADRTFYASLPGPTPAKVLDIGCGTGLIATRIAQDGHAVTGVDPAEAMLRVARNRPGGAQVTWIRGDARAAQGQFDLIYMTGHAFQTLLDDAAINTLFRTVQELLAPGGRFVFETRNPARDWVRRWHHQRDLQGPDGPVRLTRWVNGDTGDTITFTTRYDLADGPVESVSTLRFLDLAALEHAATGAGLRMGSPLGDWDGQPFDPGTSDEIICEMRLPAANRGVV